MNFFAKFELNEGSYNDRMFSIKTMMRKSLEINESFHYYEKVVIENASNLEKIIIKSHSLQDLDLLKICNCEKLINIVFENGLLYYVKNVIIESS